MTAIVVSALLAVTGFGLDLPPEINWPATADAPAERLDPPAPPPIEVLPEIAPAGLTGCSEMSWYRAAVGLPSRFDQIGYRESRCTNRDDVRTSCCHGYWQLSIALHLRDHRLAGRYHDCGVWSAADVNSDTPGDKLRQACAAKALYDTVGMSAWAATS